jgi:hypothetical protein
MEHFTLDWWDTAETQLSLSLRVKEMHLLQRNRIVNDTFSDAGRIFWQGVLYPQNVIRLFETRITAIFIYSYKKYKTFSVERNW